MPSWFSTWSGRAASSTHPATLLGTVFEPDQQEQEWAELSICTQESRMVRLITICKGILSNVLKLKDVSMEILVAAAVFIPFSALVMNAFSGESEDDFDFL